uniref:Uncharacterized protein n=1 Tax=Arundo donax TaxID=35708 RepID=A0A0A9C372_ARUDO
MCRVSRISKAQTKPHNQQNVQWSVSAQTKANQKRIQPRNFRTIPCYSSYRWSLIRPVANQAHLARPTKAAQHSA